jgi:hypothetical protein
VPLVRAAVVLAVALAVAAPARAQAPPAPPAPDERAAAREFSYAAYRLRIAIKAQKADLEQRLQTAVDALTAPACQRTLIALVGLPEATQDRVAAGAAAVAIAPAIAALRPAFQRFQAELDRVPTADPALRGGRAAWRTSLAALARFPAQVDVCATLERWRRARFAPAATPFGLDELPGGVADDGAEPKLRRAARRMQQLGVAPGTARRFAGETLLDGIFDDVEVSGSI